MTAPKSPKARAAALRVIAGERKADVARDTGVSRATLDRHLAALGHNRTPARSAKARTARALKMVARGVRKAQAARKAGVSPVTLWRALKARQQA